MSASVFRKNVSASCLVVNFGFELAFIVKVNTGIQCCDFSVHRWKESERQKKLILSSTHIACCVHDRLDFPLAGFQGLHLNIGSHFILQEETDRMSVSC